MPDAVISPSTGAVRYRTDPEHSSRISPAGRTQPSPNTSPKLRASPIAIGAGRAAVGFLRGCSADVDKDRCNPENVSWSCLTGPDRAWVVGDGLDIMSATPTAAELDLSSTVFSEKDITAPMVPASGSERPCHARLRRRALTAFLNIKEESERCSCCNKSEYWVCFDVFCAMDRSQDGAVRRGDFVWSLSAHGASVEFQRVIRRARLSAYFKSTAREISFDEFSQRIFPNASPNDIQKMQRWTCMRKAQKIVLSGAFSAKEEEMREVFSLLEEEDGVGIVALSDLVRAEILTKADILDCAPETQGPHISFDEFLQFLSPSLVRKYATEDCRSMFLESGPQAFYKESIANKLEAIHQASVLDGVLLKSPKSKDAQLLLYTAIANRSPKSQLCGTDSDQPLVPDLSTGPASLSFVSAF